MRDNARQCLLTLSKNHVSVGRRLAKLSRSEVEIGAFIKGDADLQACVDGATGN
jgi:hypothetical protein